MLVSVVHDTLYLYIPQPILAVSLMYAI